MEKGEEVVSAMEKGEEVVSAMEKGEEVVSAMEKGEEVVPPLDEVPLTDEDVVVEEPHNDKCQNYGHYHEVGPTYFCKMILAPKMECLPMPLDFTKHFPAVRTELKLKTNTDCGRRVTVRLMNDRVTLDRGWAPFAVVHQIKIRFMVTFKLLVTDTPKLTVFNDDVIEVVTKCGRHDNAFAVNV
ncbi:unnamed protein product [Triticum turgidum subsp. durum]|uniref:TF-B3 domain-containing protein n=1 Tax=Triticum turgidum subsp. durum TaxID=4567 RepID=A0A9R0VSM8_TRITD|nr:unnamed protein product [Triticum turgidum subsp. durum]